MKRIITINDWKKLTNEAFSINFKNIQKIINNFENKYRGGQDLPDELFIELANEIIADADLTQLINYAQKKDLANYLDDNWNGNKIGASVNDIAKRIEPQYNG